MISISTPMRRAVSSATAACSTWKSLSSVIRETRKRSLFTAMPSLGRSRATLPLRGLGLHQKCGAPCLYAKHFDFQHTEPQAYCGARSLGDKLGAPCADYANETVMGRPSKTTGLTLWSSFT